ncbi:MAG: lysozyme [Bacteroidales bacterium]|nr:lysozyme [Bacteroidales bacterium]MBD5223819.1 lysozyme [Bacteroidales bacterium]MBD5302281.1 lysozyme [Bacteroides sp.]
MKLLSAITIAAMALSSLLASKSNFSIVNNNAEQQTITTTADKEVSDFEKAVALIKKYEGLHQPKHYPLVGYGHRVLPGEKFSRSRALSEAEADKLLRKDLLKNCAVFREWGKDSLILGVLAYNIGSGNALRSMVAKKLKAGNRDIYDSYISHAKYRGKIHSQIQRRRIEEFETLFINESSERKLDNKEVLIEESKSANLALRQGAVNENILISKIFSEGFDALTDFISMPGKVIDEAILKSLPGSHYGFEFNERII